jgi:hypothetical protein
MATVEAAMPSVSRARKLWRAALGTTADHEISHGCDALPCAALVSLRQADAAAWGLYYDSRYQPWKVQS